MKTKRQKWIMAMIVLLIFAVSYSFRSQLGEWIAILNEGSIDDVVRAIRGFGIWGPILSMALMVLQSFIAPIPAFLITCSNGLIFGVFWGVVISWSGAMLGAAGTFYFARIFGAEYVQKLEKDGSLLKRVDEMSSRHGMRLVLIGRLLPFVSFDLLSYAAGLSRIKAKKFFIATGAGMMPATIVYVILGERVFQYGSIINAVFIVFALMTVLPWGVKKIKSTFAKKDK